MRSGDRGRMTVIAFAIAMPVFAGCGACRHRSGDNVMTRAEAFPMGGPLTWAK